MKKLSTVQQKQKEELVDKLNQLKEALENEIENFNQVAEAAWNEIQKVLEEYNNSLEEARTFIEEVTAQMSEYTDARSERWHASEAADLFREWQESWEGVDLDEVDLYQEFEPFHSPELEHSDQLADLPDSRD